MTRDGAFGDNARACLDEMWKVATEEMVRVRNEARCAEAGVPVGVH